MISLIAIIWINMPGMLYLPEPMEDQNIDTVLLAMEAPVATPTFFIIS